MTTLKKANLKPEVIEQLPRFALYPSTSEFKKDYNYYKHTDNAWNNKHRIGKRLLPYYHGLHEKAMPKINQLKQLELEDKEQQEIWKRALLTMTHKESYLRLQTRAAERKHLETASGQRRPDFQTHSNPEIEFQISEKASMNKPLQSKLVTSKHTLTDNKWNYLLEVDKKRAALLIRPESIQKEAEFIEMVQKKVKDEENVEKLREQAFKEKRNEIREKFIRRHNSNVDLDVRKPPALSNSLTPDALAKMTQVWSFGTEKTDAREQLQTPIHVRDEKAIQPHETAISTQRKPSDALTGSGETQEPHHAPEMAKTQGVSFRTRYSKMLKSSDMTSSHQNLHTEYIDTLSKPREKIKRPKNQLERNEFKGMWITQLDEKLMDSNNDFAKELTNKSPTVSTMLCSSRGSRSDLTRAGLSASTSSRFLPPSEQHRRTGSQSLMSGKISPMSTMRFEQKEQLKTTEDDTELNMKALNELEEYERKVVLASRRRGYPRIAYIEAIKLADTEGFKQLMKENNLMLQ